MNHSWHQYLFSGIFLFTGIYHFIKPKAFMRIMPRYIPYHKLLVYLSGFAEIALGTLLLFKPTSQIAAWGIALMLISFFPVHWYMIQNEKAGFGLPKWALYLRLLLQFGLIFWAFKYIK